MLTLRKSGERGRTKSEGLDSRHAFSFGDYRDPEHGNFGPLCAINEGRIAGGGSFAPRDDRDMEVVTYVLDGVLGHRDSLGNEGVVRAGEIQRLSAGSGLEVTHFNASADAPVHLLQIWIAPSADGIKPSVEQMTIDPGTVANRLSRIAAPEPRANEVRLTQDVEIWAARLSADEEVVHPIDAGRRAWIQVLRGEVSVGPHRLVAGDAAGVTDETAVAARAHAPSEILLFDMA
jgi:redox-sensitive bicupin YhaK (pirin superfamily)